ncbi:uncharacterized protein LOC106136039 [Amyelois transitella]|uniref:uncharacterized protein LOC106136039 n=1 Tax=Amyelois transitella TaxID=680683 RepID=UPI00298F3E8A|nr:uncharacterized protein LOC106136039 [Amyelois transitella]
MLAWVLLCSLSLQLKSVAAQADCNDLRGRVISHGFHYAPGPDTCTLCVCDNGLPKYCKAVLCSPPQDCRSFRVGNTCCEFICLDDVVKPAEGAEANVRVAAGGAAAVVLLTVALVVYRVRKQKRRRPPHADDQRSLTSIGYISGSMGYMGGTCETALGAWKPPSNYLPRGEAPPPYDEAIAQRPETIRITSETQFHRTYPAVDSLPRPEDGMQCSHGYVNVPRPVQQMANPQGCYNAPLLQPVHPPDATQPSVIPHHSLPQNVVGFPSAIRLTGSLGAISNRGLSRVLQRDPAPTHERPHNVPGFYTAHTSLHRTIPRVAPALEAALLDGSLAFSRDRVLHAEIRRSFHKPGSDSRHDTGRSMPRNLNLAAERSDRPDPKPSLDDNCGGRAGRHRAASCELAPAAEPSAAPHSTLPLTVDKPSCVCSYSGGVATGSEEADDYRSECENCKAGSSSRWASEPAAWDGPEAEGGTQTLQRRAPPPAPPPPATATLPQPVTKQSRTVMGPPSNWENWFNTIHDSDTESEEE